jgi:hypothetical protein
MRFQLANLSRYADMSGDCWIWQRYISKDGYGRLWYKGQKYVAHKLVYELVFGKVPDGLTLDHLCRNRSCVNPFHLEPVTRGENVLRGDTLPAKNVAKTCCPLGHPLSGANLVTISGARRCRICKNKQRREWAKRHPGYRRTKTTIGG